MGGVGLFGLVVAGAIFSWCEDAIAIAMSLGCVAVAVCIETCL